MDATPTLAWLFWDPPREAFTVPFLDQPVVWYGILFVTGFILGYFVIVPIFTHFLTRTKNLSTIDILNWPQLIKIYQTSNSPLIAEILKLSDPSVQIQLTSGSLLTLELKEKIIAGLNRFLKESSYDRNDLVTLFAGSLASAKQTAYFLVDRLCWFTVAGTIIGARLGEVFFYNWAYYSKHPIEIFKTWHGGLASHGGVIGVMIALFLYLKYVQKWVPQLTFIRLLDFVAIPSALVAFFIRMGNFMNQEILGTPTTLPWAVVFGHPEDRSPVLIARHPVQLYEGFAYLLTFFILWNYWKKEKDSEKPGAIVGLLFILIFGSRFILEFWKSTQDSLLHSSYIQMGQLLSIPFIIGGFLLWWRAINIDKNKNI